MLHEGLTLELQRVLAMREADKTLDYRMLNNNKNYLLV